MRSGLPSRSSRSVTGIPLQLMRAESIVRFLLEDTRMFVSAVLTPESHQLLLERVPPLHSKVYAHHVTMAYDPDEPTLERYRSLEGQRIKIPVTAVAHDDKVQAVLVGVDSENEYPHITISVAEGVEPKYSNELFNVGPLYHTNIFTLEGDVTIEPLEPPA